MDFEASSFAEQATCITEGIYSDALTYGKKYEIIVWDKKKHQIKIQGDAGRIRWYPCGCFDMTGGIVPKLLRIVRYDAVSKHGDWIEVEIELSNNEHRWCYFITPAMLSQLKGDISFGSERLLSYNAPHMIIVSSINEEILEQILKYIESQGAILDCTKLITLNEDKDEIC